MSTLAQLKTQVLQRADMENSNFVAQTTELVTYINDSARELYDLLVSKYEDYFLADAHSLTVASGSSSGALPADFYKMRGVDRNISGDDWHELRPFNFRQRNRSNAGFYQSNGQPSIEYRILDNEIHFTPKGMAPGSYQLWYVPKYTALSVAGDSLPAQMAQWEIYVVTDAAIKCLQKEESDVSVLMAQKAELRQRIEMLAANRDAGEPEQITDVYAGWDEI